MCFIGAGHDWGIDGLKNGVIKAIESLTSLNNVKIEDLTHVLILISRKEIQDNENIQFIDVLLREIPVDVMWVEDAQLENDEVRSVVIGA